MSVTVNDLPHRARLLCGAEPVFQLESLRTDDGNTKLADAARRLVRPSRGSAFFLNTRGADAFAHAEGGLPFGIYEGARRSQSEIVGRPEVPWFAYPSESAPPSPSAFAVRMLPRFLEEK